MRAPHTIRKKRGRIPYLLYYSQKATEGLTMERNSLLSIFEITISTDQYLSNLGPRVPAAQT